MLDVDKLLEKLAEERKVIKGAPFHFAFACVLALLITGGIWYAIFEVTLKLQHETIEAYKNKQELVESAAKHSPSGSLQILTYTKDPNAEKVLPPNTNAPAIAYADAGDNPVFTWSTNFHKWK
jgi:hypothetical protein